MLIALRALWRKPLSRADLSVLVSLLLLGYLVMTAGLGAFWVSQMQLPPFDLHYLAGYCLLAVSALHVALQFGAIVRFFKRMSPKMRWITIPSLAALLSVPLFWILSHVKLGSAPHRLVVKSATARPAGDATSAPATSVAARAAGPCARLWSPATSRTQTGSRR